MFDKINLKAMCHYEKLTGKNALELMQREKKSATDLRDLVFLVKYTKDNKTTFETVEEMSDDDLEAVMKELGGKKE